MAWADGVTIMGNVFSAPPVRAGAEKPHSPISARDSQDIHIGGNTVNTPDTYVSQFAHVGLDIALLTPENAADGR